MSANVPDLAETLLSCYRTIEKKASMESKDAKNHTFAWEKEERSIRYTERSNFRQWFLVCCGCLITLGGWIFSTYDSRSILTSNSSQEAYSDGAPTIEHAKLKHSSLGEPWSQVSYFL